MAMLKVEAAPINADNLEVSITITMPLIEWERLKDQQPQRFPAWKLAEAIDRAIRRIRQNVTEPITPEE